MKLKDPYINAKLFSNTLDLACNSFGGFINKNIVFFSSKLDNISSG